MRIRVEGFAAIVGSLALCLGLPALGQGGYGPYTGPALTNGEAVVVEYVSGYTAVYGGFGAGIYNGAVGPGGPISPDPTIGSVSTPKLYPTGIICDDYNDEITSQAWNANAWQASTLTTGNVGELLFGKTVGLGGYAEVATLDEMMFGNGMYAGKTYTQAEISAALWDITTPGGIDISSDPNIATLVGALDSVYGAEDGAATSTSLQLTAAGKYLSGLTNLWILTPNPKNGPPNDPGQEMSILVPEGGAGLLYLLLAGASCFGAMALSRRRFGSRA